MVDDINNKVVLDLDYYNTFNPINVILDNYVLDVLLPEMRPGSVKIWMFMKLRSSSDLTFTYDELKEETGLHSSGSMWQCLAELEDGLPATKKRKAIHGFHLISRENRLRYSKHVHGNSFTLNNDYEAAGYKYPLIYGPNHQLTTAMHPWLIDKLMPQLTPHEWVIFVYLFRVTLGFQKPWDSLTLGYFTGKRKEYYKSGMDDYEGQLPPGIEAKLKHRRIVRSLLAKLEGLGLKMAITTPKKKWSWQS